MWLEPILISKKHECNQNSAFNALFELIRDCVIAMLDDMKLITGAQIKLARAILNLSKPQLSKQASIGVTTITRMESAYKQVPDVKWQTLHGLEQFLTQELSKIGWQWTPEGGISPIPYTEGE